MDTSDSFREIRSETYQLYCVIVLFTSVLRGHANKQRPLSLNKDMLVCPKTKKVNLTFISISDTVRLRRPRLHVCRKRPWFKKFITEYLPRVKRPTQNSINSLRPSDASHYLNQCWNTVNWTPRNKLQWNVNRNSCIFIHKNPFEKVVWKWAAILSRPQCVNKVLWCTFARVTLYDACLVFLNAGLFVLVEIYNHNGSCKWMQRPAQNAKHIFFPRLVIKIVYMIE